MNTTHFICASGALTLGLLMPAASAQDTDQPRTAQPPKHSTTVSTTGLSTAPARASDIIGAEIVDAAGKEFATIKDLAVSDSGEVVACVEREDDLLVCVPLDQLQARFDDADDTTQASEPGRLGKTPEIAQFLLKGDRALLDSAPGVKEMKLVDGACLKRSVDHFDGKPMSKDDMDAHKAKTGSDTAMISDLKAHCVKALIGENVKGTDGDGIGDIKDLAIDLSNGKVAYAIVSAGGVLGVGNTLHAVAYDRLTVNEEWVTIPMTKDGVSKLPNLDMDRLPANPTGSLDADVPAPTDRKRG